MKRPANKHNRRDIIPFVILAIVAVALSMMSFQYSNYLSANISAQSNQTVRTNTQIQASDLSHIFQERLRDIASSLLTLSHAQSVIQQNTSEASPLFNQEQNSTGPLTSLYFWLDSRGILILASNGTVGANFPSLVGRNLSSRNYFIEARAKETTFFSSATQSIFNSSTDLLFVSQPVFANNSANGNSSRRFAGVVGAVIDLKSLGSFLKGQLSTEFQSSFTLLDLNGTILYSSDTQTMDQNVFSSQFQATIAPDSKGQFNSFIRAALQGNSGVGNCSLGGVSYILAYTPVLDSAGNNLSQPTVFGALYVANPNTLAASSAALIEQQRLGNIAIICGIAGVSIVIAYIGLRWNKRLDAAVQEKTSQLVFANKQLEAQSNSQKDLINIAAHELRTPTQSILANAELLQDSVGSDSGGISAFISSDGSSSQNASEISGSEVLELVASTYRNAQRLEKLTQNLLDVARIENNTLQMATEHFDLNELIRHVIQDTQRLSQHDPRSARNLTMVIESDLQELPVMADKTRVDLIVSNLLSNAMNHSREGGNITVYTKKLDDGFALVEVRDEGSGIDPEIVPRLFSKFATKSGTGLGLYISKSYVEAQGGKIWAENNSSGKAGATFSFTLPLPPPNGSFQNNP